MESLIKGKIYLEEIWVWDVSVIVEVVNPEGKPQLGLYVGLGAELSHAAGELREVDLATPVRIKHL